MLKKIVAFVEGYNEHYNIDVKNIYYKIGIQIQE